MDPMLVDLDYTLGCLLAALFRQRWADVLLFKGGTCLRKCYFADYRFSEDLDFTVTQPLSVAELERGMRETVRIVGDDWQLDFALRPFRVEKVEDGLGGETYRVRLYYRGPLRRAGDPRAVRLDFTLDEVVVFPPVVRPIIHPYPDAPTLSTVQARCYCLQEILAEKVRALLGQRRYAIARDLYDVAELIARSPVELRELVRALPPKFEVKGLPMVVDLPWLEGRRPEFKLDWERSLTHLLPTKAADFEPFWEKVASFLRKLAEHVPG